MSKDEVKVRRKDLIKILDHAAAYVSWPKDTWEAFDRLIAAAGGSEEDK